MLGLVPQMSVVLFVLERLYQAAGVSCVITAGNDGSHSETSEHYAGRALDFRTRDLHPEAIKDIAAGAQAAIGGDYGVLLEADHLHVHYRPKRPEDVST